jgi:uncharacterized protein (TIGR02118 family)
MIKLMLLISRKPGMSREKFIEYYETRHIPLVQELLPPLPYYRRSYPRFEPQLTGGMEPPPDFDVITEIAFPSREAALGWFKQWNSPEVRARIVPDEENFVVRESIRMFVVDEHNSGDEHNLRAR